MAAGVSRCRFLSGIRPRKARDAACSGIPDAGHAGPSPPQVRAPAAGQNHPPPACQCQEVVITVKLVVPLDIIAVTPLP
jgi:hypothetical protein